jgi:2-C-methyl-D-erythritol 4-phosphate cytidylyltransferase
LRVGTVLVAAGRSSRMGFDKLWAPLGGRPVLAWSLDKLTTLDRVVLVVAPKHVDRTHRLVGRLGLSATVVEGGERRRDSVGAGVDALGDCEWLLVHDAARPFLTPRLVLDGLDAARATGAAVAAVPARDTIKRVADSDVVETLPRSELWAVQTPQIFRRDLLVRALASTDEDVTDEAALVERLGVTVRVYPGDELNFKITTPADLDLARALLQLRAGQGP